MLTDQEIRRKLIGKEKFTETEADEIIRIKNMFHGRIVAVPADERWRTGYVKERD